MALKRKLDSEVEAVPHKDAKQLKLIPFPYASDPDIEMSDSSASSDAEPFFENFHTRAPSNASSSSATSDVIDFNSPLYPRFQLYPSLITDSDIASRGIGLLQPASTFTHHGTSCSQIPKLRVACSAGADGQRTMWSFCEQCGAISMVDSD